MRSVYIISLLWGAILSDGDHAIYCHDLSGICVYTSISRMIDRPTHVGAQKQTGTICWPSRRHDSGISGIIIVRWQRARASFTFASGYGIYVRQFVMWSIRDKAMRNIRYL